MVKKKIIEELECLDVEFFNWYQRFVHVLQHINRESKKPELTYGNAQLLLQKVSMTLLILKRFDSYDELVEKSIVVYEDLRIELMALVESNNFDETVKH